jgi:hypothetical protein
VSALDLDIRVSREEVYRNLGYGRSGRPTDRISRRLEELWPGGLDRLAPRGVWALIDHDQAVALEMVHPPAQAAVGLVTIGPDLEAEVDRLNHGGELLDALLLDAIGSAGAEAAADALDRIVCEEATALGLHAGRRFSPGYGRWGVEHQEQLLGHVPAAEIGVTLTPGMMMIPRKSVSFAVRYLDHPPRKREGRHRCSTCERRETCAFRKD